MHGLVPFYKPPGITSYDIIRRIKKWIGKEKIGHGGTLDPFAEGVLVLGIKEGTKKLNEILNKSRKIYRAIIFLGAESTTDDPEGEIKIRKGINFPQEYELIEVLKRFKGEILQTPPVYSAIKVNGVPSYKLAREGKEVNLKPRKVFIEKIDLVKYFPPELEIEIISKSGVYIRALARDLGNFLGTSGYLKKLIRLQVDEFKIDQAITLEDVERNYIEAIFKLKGLVQGVGFRFFAKREAKKLEINGFARNISKKSALFGLFSSMQSTSFLEIIAQGKEKNLQKFEEIIKVGPPLSRVEKIEVLFRHPQKIYYDFEII